MKYRHLFWDFDGTLFDSYPQISAALARTLAEFGIPVKDNASLMPYLKHSVFYAIKYFATEYQLDVQALLERFHHHHRMERSFPPYEGLGQCLAKLREAGCCHYLYTHRDMLAIDLLQQYDLWQYFTDAVTSCDGYPHKPAPDALLSMISKHRIAPQQAIMIGDRGIDIESGFNAGISGAVFDPDRQYLGPNAQIYAKSMSELAQRLLDT